MMISEVFETVWILAYDFYFGNFWVLVMTDCWVVLFQLSLFFDSFRNQRLVHFSSLDYIYRVELYIVGSLPVVDMS